MTTIVVDTVTLEFMNMWPSSLTNPPIVTSTNSQVALETSEDPSILVAVKDSETGEVSLVPDPTKLAAKTAQTWTDLRARRNALLASCDWVALADANLSQERKDAWFAYRQELRDLPEEVTDPLVVVWPAVPGTVPAAPVSGSRVDNLLGQV